MKYPIGIQTFARLREENFVYVDKTALVYRLTHDGVYYFLSRPRRFGKSLLVSTLRAYFEGRRELFAGLAIDAMETEWKQYPVLQMDLNTVQRGDPDSIDILLDNKLRQWEAAYGVTFVAAAPGVRFANVIRAAYERTGQKVAILIDEYDKPILAQLESEGNTTLVREKLKAFYSVLKSEDPYIRFALLTGVTRFSKVSIFSDLNNLSDISMDPRYAELCGISEAELHAVFDDEVAALAAQNRMTREACYEELRRRYDGYHFTVDSVGMYNPFSVLNTFEKRRFSSYWFATGTPTFLVGVIQRTHFDFMRGLQKAIPASELSDVDSVQRSPMPILFQSGYLTIKDYNPEFDSYYLDYPNAEVREGFIKFLLPHLSAARTEDGSSIQSLIMAVRSGDTETMEEVFQTLFDKHGNYMLYEGKSKERDFRNIVYMVFCLLDIYTQAELCTARGRMDISVETQDYVYVIELKIDQSAEAALEQITKNGYADRYTGDPRQLILLGVNFSTKTNSIDGWLVG